MSARPWYATGARQLLEARQQGLAPKLPVVVSLVPEQFEGPRPLHVRDDMPVPRLDWRMLVDLDVWVWATKAAPLATVLGVTHAVARARPKTLFLRFEDAQGVHDIDVGSATHFAGTADIPPIHEFQWWPQRTVATALAARLQQALCRQQPARSFL